MRDIAFKNWVLRTDVAGQMLKDSPWLSTGIFLAERGRGAHLQHCLWWGDGDTCTTVLGMEGISLSMVWKCQTTITV